MKNELIGKYGFKKVLYDEAIKNKIELDERMLERLEIYKDLLLEYNEKINLTAITDEYEIIIKHFVDSLECVKHIKKSDSVIDIGTGAGFPGLVIAIYFNGAIKMTLLDALNKRLIFLEEIVKKLEIKNIKIIHGRAEDLAVKSEYRECYDVVVSRAVANLAVLLEFDSPYIKVGGTCLLLKGDNVDEEILNAKNALKILNMSIKNKYMYSYIFEEEEYNRCILNIEKIKSTPIKYPRSYGKIKKEQL